ncbi:UTRA domain-containing protein [Spinactinospora alkalitolerans]|nr:UTRA domain-containing protein [Spinactinospora alkalitolerans]
MESPRFTYRAALERVRGGGVDADALDDQIARAGRRPSKTGFAVGTETPPEEVAGAVGSPALVRRSVRCVDGSPAAIETSYYPLDIASGTELETHGDIARGTINVLAELGHAQVRYVDDVAARMPSADEAAELGIGADIPVLRVDRTAFSTDRAIRVTRTVTVTGTGHGMPYRYEVGSSGAAS